MRTVYIGVDPGASGGIVAIDASGRVLEALKLRPSEYDPKPGADRGDMVILERLESLRDMGRPRAAIEHVWSTPGQGGAFAFGGSVRSLRMALTAKGIPYIPVLPRRWQKDVGVEYVKGMTDTAKKNTTKERAIALFPRVTITHAIADALLIAEWCRRTYERSK